MQDSAQPTVGSPLRRRLVLVCCALLPVLTGCYEARYEKNLKVTEQLYHHFDLLNRNLGPAWQSANGIQFRSQAGSGGVPKQFTEIPGPPPPEVDENGKIIVP
ncbi:MAG TPA: hypothetical protein VHB77_01255, partial [Planctomycetaceae bacterium]|nr:hypothetical protein [Planctomycetaceae bacterium]